MAACAAVLHHTSLNTAQIIVNEILLYLWLIFRLKIIQEVLLTTNWICIRSQSVTDQLVLERCDPPTNVRARDGFDEDSPLLDAKAVHLALSLLLFLQQQTQLSITVQVNVGTTRVCGGFDANREASSSRRQCVGSKVHDDRPRGVEPLQGALGTT